MHKGVSGGHHVQGHLASALSRAHLGQFSKSKFKSMSSTLIAGTIAIDSVKTQQASRDEILGGSASYSAIAASFHAPVNLVGVVGDDFPQEHMDMFSRLNIDTSGVEIREGGKTFRWTGEYSADMNSRETLDVALNVIEDYEPELSEDYRKSSVVLLANMAPATQMKVLDQIEAPKFVIADSMDLWIDIARDDLLALLKRLDLFVINEGEARQFTGSDNLITAGHRLLEFGSTNVVIKKGEHGALLFGPEGQFFTCGAFPLPELVDPTGAGDTFAGGLAGVIAAGEAHTPTFGEISRAIVTGSVLASFTCEEFSTEKLQTLSRDDIAERLNKFRHMCSF